ncbi:MAG: ImmA/IrrE family metallo-endopeptidase [Spirochaetales bacterium]|nr:ImmA/IrrE family metallo-endopeptidase [Spirochaetales bacterium]
MEIKQTIVVEPKSRMDLRALAHKIRTFLGLAPDMPFPAVEVLEVLHYFIPEAYFEILPAEEMQPQIHADTDITNRVIQIREDVYEGACKGNGRDRMTIVHEFAHFIMLCYLGFKLSRAFGNTVETYRDPEWQAKCLAGELMMDSRVIAGMDVYTVSEKYGVSEDAARMQLSRV